MLILSIDLSDSGAIIDKHVLATRTIERARPGTYRPRSGSTEGTSLRTSAMTILFG
jgi:hypothetical protein